MYNASPKDGAAWVTGASEGIGKAVAIELAGEGYTVYASARSAEKLEKLAGEFNGAGEIIPLPLDVTDRKAAIACVETITAAQGALSLVILNAGTFYPVRGKELAFEDFDKTYEVNVNGVLNCMIPAVEAMKQAGRGQVAVVSSVAGYGGLPKNAAYGISKAGLINMAESLKFDFDRMNIRIQIVTPGFIDTPLTQKNDFPMPFLMDVDLAAKRLAKELRGNGFEITFPRRFTYLLKFLNIWVYPVYFWLVRRMTGG